MAAARSTASWARARARSRSPPPGGRSARDARATPTPASRSAPASARGLVRRGLGLVDPALQEQRPAEEGGGPGGLAVEATLAQVVVAPAQVRLGRVRLAVEQLDEAGGDLGLEQAGG